MNRVPGSVPTAQPVEMAELRCSHSVAGPVGAGMVRRVRIRAPVRLRSGEDLVLVGSVADAVEHVTLFTDGRGLGHAVAQASDLEGVSMQLGDISRDHLSLGVGPRTASDAIARVDRAGALGAEIGVPSGTAPSH